jgi:DNA-binding Xre family transcriptional regulator
MSDIWRESAKDGRFDLQYGPYHPPRVRRGGKLFCEHYGTVKVVKFSDGPIPWPLYCPTGRGGRAFVLCGDLVRAIRHEAAGAVALAWGVWPNTIVRWRKILGVKQYNTGTQNLFLKYQGKALTPEMSVIARTFRTVRQETEWARQRREQGLTRQRVWTPEEDLMLGTMSDTELARRLQCAVSTVARRRRDRHIPLCPGVRGGRNTSNLPRYSAAKLQTRRLELGLFQGDVAARGGWKDKASYQRLESGRADRARPDILARLAKALECDVADLLADDDSRK